ncbi:MAG: hypothetical protein E6G97_06885 [Alphaproteobacteria bacterium]|nr:MAG: hypothetical protein E6G97_06885 [Alphaproteobacteria bacterium]
MAGDAPEFGNAPSFITDTLMTHAVSEDKKAITITFGNFTNALVPNGPPVSVRTFTVVLPLKNVPAGATLTGGLQGVTVMQPGTSAMLIFRAGGVSHVFEPLLGPGETDSFTKPINIAVPERGDLRMTIIVALEGSPTDPKAEAVVNVTAVDLEIGPPQPPLQV